MAYYAVNIPQQMRSGQRALVLPPLLVTLAFCFGFILMQSHPSLTTKAVDSTNQTSNESVTGEASPLSPSTNSTLPPLSVVVDNSDNPAPPSTDGVNVAQPDAGASLQAATGDNANMTITVPSPATSHTDSRNLINSSTQKLSPLIKKTAKTTTTSAKKNK